MQCETGERGEGSDDVSRRADRYLEDGRDGKVLPDARRGLGARFGRHHRRGKLIRTGDKVRVNGCFKASAVLVGRELKGKVNEMESEEM